MPRFKRGRNLDRWKSDRPRAGEGKLRIIGGRFRGRQIAYSGDPVTRPMKDDVREALFNLVGGWMEGKAVFDLFAGTGAVGLEAISRGAAEAVLLERHFPSARLIRENVDSLGEELAIEVEASDSFFWTRQFQLAPERWPTRPWAVFCCPPYDLFRSQQDELLEMIRFFFQAAPPESVIVVESDQGFDPAALPEPDLWRVRDYPPARLAVFRPGPESAPEAPASGTGC